MLPAAVFQVRCQTYGYLPDCIALSVAGTHFLSSQYTVLEYFVWTHTPVPIYTYSLGLPIPFNGCYQ